jgi:hypothetical protein
MEKVDSINRYWITCPKVCPVLSAEVIEGQEGIGTLGQAVNSLWVLGSVLGLKRGDNPLGMIWKHLTLRKKRHLVSMGHLHLSSSHCRTTQA